MRATADAWDDSLLSVRLEWARTAGLKSNTAWVAWADLSREKQMALEGREESRR